MIKESSIGKDIRERFFAALNVMIGSGRLKSYNEFISKHDICHSNFMQIKNNPSIGQIKAEWIYYVCDDFCISTEWIIFGVGNFFCERKRV